MDDTHSSDNIPYDILLATLIFHMDKLVEQYHKCPWNQSFLWSVNEARHQSLLLLPFSQNVNLHGSHIDLYIKLLALIDCKFFCKRISDKFSIWTYGQSKKLKNIYVCSNFKIYGSQPKLLVWFKSSLFSWFQKLTN